MLSPREKNVAQKVIAGMDEREACRCHNMRYDRLLELYESHEFNRYLEALCDKYMRKSQMELARFGVCAVKKLGMLLDNDKEETVRRTAVDILNKCQEFKKNNVTEGERKQQSGCDMSDEQARAMLAKLAENSAGDG